MGRNWPSRWAAALLCAISAPSLAQISRVVGPIPVTATSQMFGPADFPGAKLGVPLKSYDYVEEEYFLDGKAAAYERGPEGLRPRTDKLPYTTRIIVRRPRQASRFSGVVHFEPIHPTQGYNGHWLVLSRYLMARGDAYVFAGVGDASKGWSGSPNFQSGSGPIGQNRILKWFDPVRYAPISWPEEEGIRYEVMTDIGRKLRSDDADNPLHGFKVRAMLVGGWSYTGSIQRTFINEGFHDRARLANGRPIFDGYLIGVSSSLNAPGYLPLYNDEPLVPIGDPRRTLKKTDAKVIEFLTESEVELAEGPELPDSDAAIGGHRVYEFPGVIHVDSLHDPAQSSRERPNFAQLAQKGYQFKSVSEVSVTACALPQSDLPQDAFVRGAVDNLRQWVLDGRVPPRAQPLLRAKTGFERDEAGNLRGGVPVAELAVPLAAYGRYLGDDLPGCKTTKPYPNSFFVRIPLPHERLVARYGTAAGFVGRYDRATDALVRDHWLLPEDALKLKAKAREAVAGGL